MYEKMSNINKEMEILRNKRINNTVTEIALEGLGQLRRDSLRYRIYQENHQKLKSKEDKD